MFDRLSRSWQLVKASASVLKQDRMLVLFPLISSVAMLAVLASFAIPVMGWVVFSGRSATGSAVAGSTFYALGFLFYLTQYFVIFFFNAALVGAAMIRLDGGDPTLSDGLRLAASRWTSILGYAAIAATVGLVLRVIAERVGFLGRLITSLLGAGWTVATFLVVPVLVARDVGPAQAVKESALILKRTWGENLVGQAGLGVAFALIQFVVVLLGVALVGTAMAGGSAILIVLSLMLTIGCVLLSILVHGALSGIYAAALYRFATQNGNAQGFAPDALRGAFVAKA
ncbi:MAG: hypothetical protein KAX59_01905 [Acidovorax sp.]|jgi:hypothetical protein|nr:hypothetical protein [Acidovorax sp.]